MIELFRYGLLTLAILFLIWLLHKLKTTPKRIIIFEDTKKSPQGIERTYWVGNKEFRKIENARVFARSLK